MNNKIIVAIVAAIVIIAGVGVFFLLQEKDKELNVISGVNTDGSGIFIDESIDINTMFDFSTEIPTPIKSGWEGKIFTTPGTSTIQHVQLLTIVKSMGMNFVGYTVGTSPAPDTVYFTTNKFNAVLVLGEDNIDGGILWQPQYQKIVDDDRFKELVLTNDIFPGHACCVIGASHEYVVNHEDEVVKFLAAFIKATDWVNRVMAEGEGADYDRLIEVSKNVAGPNFTNEEIKEALETIVFYYGDNNNDPLKNLRNQIASLSENLVELDQTNRDLQALGFEDGDDFANKFVNDSFILKAFQLLENDEGESDAANLTEIKVAVISGDIHQIAIHMAKELGYFEEYGLNIVFVPATNGSGVATSLQNGGASLGLLGAPPFTITVINGELVRA